MFARSLEEWAENAEVVDGVWQERSSRDLNEFISEFESKIPAAGPRGMRKFSDDVARHNYYAFFQTAIQGVAGKKVSVKRKADLAEAIADAAMSRFANHLRQVNCALDGAKDVNTRNILGIVLNLSGPWGDSFKGALQTTSGLDHVSPAEAVNLAADLADQAMLASGELEESLWNAFMKCAKP